VQGRWRGVTVGCAAGRNPGLTAAAFNGAGGAAQPRNSGRAGTPCGAPLIAVVRPTCDARKSEGRDGVQTAGSTSYAARAAR
jgi:hypothetical protein